MTRADFDAWLETHYTELVKVAERRSNGDANDTVHDAVLTFLEHRNLAEIEQPWTYLVNAIRSVAGHRRRSEDRAEEMARAVETLNRAGHSLGRKRPAPSAE